jgi:hypothetical protein
MYAYNQKYSGWFDGECHNYQNEWLNETYVEMLSRSCNNGSSVTFFGEPKYEIPDGESALSWYEYFSNGTSAYYYANGTVHFYDPWDYWQNSGYPHWKDEDCEYI